MVWKTLHGAISIDEFLPDFDINVRYPEYIEVNGEQRVWAGDTALHAAARGGSLDVVRALLKKGIRVDACDEVFGGSHFYPLFIAVRDGHNKVVEALLKAGAEVDRKNGCGCKTALAQASEAGHLEVVQTLLKGGAKVKGVDEDGGTFLNALTIACKEGHLEVVKVLCAAKTVYESFTKDDYAQARDAANERKEMAKKRGESQEKWDAILHLLTSA